MKTYRNIFYLFIFMFCGHTLQAREEPKKTFKNSVKLHTGSFSLGRFRFMGLTRLCGVSAERKLSKNFSASLGYFQWSRSAGWRFKAEMGEYPYELDTTPGAIIGRIGYAMLDMSALYRHNLYRQRHFLKAGIGISYSWGENRCVDHLYYSLFHGWVGPDDIQKVHYWGLVPQVSYDFLFLRDRVNVGMDVRGRLYLHIPNHQYDIGIHAGVNF